MSDPNPRFRRAAITFHSDDPLPEVPDYVTFICGQQEVAPTTGRVHWQLYMEFSAQKNTRTIQKWLPACHVEPAKGTQQQNIAYVSKLDTAVPGTYFQTGEPKHQGKRNDLHEVVSKISTGSRLTDMLSDASSMCVYVKHTRGIHSLVSLQATKLGIIERHVEWHWGVSGSGKTHHCFEAHKPEDICIVNGMKWFDGYYGQKAILFDDVDEVEFDRQMLLRITDKYPLQLPVKGSFFPCLATHIYFTSNRPPDGSWLPPQLFCRINVILEWTVPYEKKNPIKDASPPSTPPFVRQETFCPSSFDATCPSRPTSPLPWTQEHDETESCASTVSGTSESDT